MDFLSVKAAKIVGRGGEETRLRGPCVGGWMNMENFINGFPGCESGIRRAMAKSLGEELSSYFFNSLLDKFLTEADVDFIRKRGANVARLALNYRHFEDDEAPFVYKEDGFARLERAVDWCERRGLYVILDLHAAPGWQNSHWHSDNETGASLLWRHKQFQDRTKALWREFARRYRGRAVIAGYDLLNEPMVNTPSGDRPHAAYENYQPDWPKLNQLFRDLVSAVREIDPDHIIFLEGDSYGHDLDGLEPPFTNNVAYSCHQYTLAGFGPGAYPGEFKTYRVDQAVMNGYWDRARQDRVFRQSSGARYAAAHGVPLWVGEFGAQYNTGANDLPYRLKAMDDQLDVYNERGAHWTTWTYKDMGVMGWVTVDPASEYAKLVAPVQRLKAALGAENFVGWYENPIGKEANRELARTIAETIGDPKTTLVSAAACLATHTLTGYAADCLQPLYCSCFNGMDKTDIDRVLSAFELKNCVVNKDYIKILEKRLR